MPKVAKELSPVEVKRLVKPGFHAVGEVTGLHLQVTNSGARSWILRVKIGTKRRDIGLGGFPSVPLAEAKHRAREARKLVAEGIDPLAEKARKRAALVAGQMIPTFDECSADYIAAKGPEFRNAKHLLQWSTSLATYASPTIGKMQVDRVNKTHVLTILQPLWYDKTETATRVRGRIERVLDFAKASGHRVGDNPAMWRGNLDALLPKPNKLKAVEHHAALPFAEVPDFLERLAGQAGTAARALELAILTATRSGEVRGAQWEEFDTKAAVWTIPASRMKAGKEHRVPLSAAAVRLIRSIPEPHEGIVFKAPRARMLSDMALGAVLKRMGVATTSHGFRSSFRDWAGETTAFPREVIEHALAHQLKDKAEAAYARGTLFDKRRQLMEAWAQHCQANKQSAKVTPIRRRTKS